MSEWRKVKLSDIADIRIGQSPLSLFYNNEGRGLPFLQGCADFGVKYPNTDIYCSERTKVAPENSILISVRAPVGLLNMADQEYIIGRGLSAILPEVQNDYLFYSIEFNVNALDSKSQGSTFSAINSKELNNFELYITLNPREQQKIADIFLSIDKVIETTRQVVEKYKAIKQGMLHDLFTRGVDRNGKLRPTPAEAPELYQSSEQGLIPKDWVIKCLGKLGETYTGLSGKTKDSFGIGKPYIPYLNIFTNGRINRFFLELVDVKSNENQNVVKKGDLFFTTSSETVEEVGMTSVLLDDIGEVYLNSFCFGFRLYNYDELKPEFASYLFRSERIRAFISRLGQGSTRYNLPKSQLLNKLYISFPKDEEEQYLIVKILNGIDDKINNEQETLSKYKAIKQGLMADLLSGKKRVTIQE